VGALKSDGYDLPLAAALDPEADGLVPLYGLLI